MSEVDYDETIGDDNNYFLTREEALSHPAECPCKECHSNPAELNRTGEDGELWLHFKDGTQSRFSDQAQETIVKVMKYYKPTPATAHPEDFCEKCGGRNITWFAPSPLWNKYAVEYGILCPLCFVELARAELDAWKIAPEFYAEHSALPLHHNNGWHGAEDRIVELDDKVAALKEKISELLPYEKFAMQLTDACTRWGWSHCTAGPELIEQVDYILTQLEAAENSLHSTQDLLAAAERRWKRDQAGGKMTHNDAVITAIVLLQHWADQIKDCHTVPDTGEWINEQEAWTAYNEIVAAIRALAPDRTVTAQHTDLDVYTRPILYTDSINGEQVCRDDLWALTTLELAELLSRIAASPIAKGRSPASAAAHTICGVIGFGGLLCKYQPNHIGDHSWNRPSLGQFDQTANDKIFLRQQEQIDATLYRVAEARVRELTNALNNLVRLKMLKDEANRTNDGEWINKNDFAYYNAQKPKAWQEAFNVLKRIKDVAVTTLGQFSQTAINEKAEALRLVGATVDEHNWPHEVFQHTCCYCKIQYLGAQESYICYKCELEARTRHPIEEDTDEAFRLEGMELAIVAVEDAGGDNEQYHANAIRAEIDRRRESPTEQFVAERVGLLSGIGRKKKA
jgi:hypothetical protein